ncbi:MAG: indole-3-glycerol-phosphate synthase [Pseudomonadales bacterium]|nr:indole-3-glycerol-phosphate synthase [Pseudomonadales bacterium]
MLKKPLSLVASIRRRQQEGLLPVISEVKVSSPKEGDLMLGRDPIVVGKTMNSCPIAGLSVIFIDGVWGGSVELMEQICQCVSVPVLAKGFHTTSNDVEVSASAGASAVLLSICMLSDEQLLECNSAAHRFGVETLIEIHDEDGLQRIADLGIRPDILGINNRNIMVGETDNGDVSNTERLAAKAPAGTIVLSASAIEGPGDALRARDAGADVVLVGTSILRAADTEKAINDLVGVGWKL